MVLDPGRCLLGFGAAAPSVAYRGIHLVGFDAIIPRVAATTDAHGIAVVRQFESSGIFCLNDSAGIARARDKLACIQVLSSAGIAVPRTGFVRSPRYAEDLVRLVGGPPVVIKVLEGAQGVGVVLADSLRAARSALEAFWGLKVEVVVQEYVGEARGADLRCLVLGGEVAAAMLRQSTGDDFRSNIHRGGRGDVAACTDEEVAIALRAAAAVGLRFAGVDIVRSHRGPLVLEVNSSPGLEGVEEATGIDLADRIVAYVESEIARRASAKSPDAG